MAKEEKGKSFNSLLNKSLSSLEICIREQPWNFEYYYHRMHTYLKLSRAAKDKELLVTKAEEDLVRCMNLRPNDERVMDLFLNEILLRNILFNFIRMRAYLKSLSYIAYDPIQELNLFYSDFNTLASLYTSTSTKKQKKFEHSPKKLLDTFEQTSAPAAQKLVLDQLISIFSHPDIKAVKERVNEVSADKKKLLSKAWEKIQKEQNKLQNIQQVNDVRKALVKSYTARDKTYLNWICHNLEEGLPILKRLFESDSENIYLRYLAAKALAEIPVPRGQQILKDHLHNNLFTTTRIFAIQVLEPDKPQNIFDRSWRNKLDKFPTFVRALAAKSFTSKELQTQLMKDPHFVVRLYSAQVSNPFRNKDSAKIFATLAEHPNEQIRAWFSWHYLEKIKVPSFEDVKLLQKLMQDPSLTVRRVTIRRISEMDKFKDRPTLLSDALKYNQDFFIRFHSLMVLGDSVQKILPYLGSTKEMNLVRASLISKVMYKLKDIGYMSSLPPAEQRSMPITLLKTYTGMLDDPDHNVRLAASSNLGWMSDSLPIADGIIRSKMKNPKTDLKTRLGCLLSMQGGKFYKFFPIAKKILKNPKESDVLRNFAAATAAFLILSNPKVTQEEKEKQMGSFYKTLQKENLTQGAAYGVEHLIHFHLSVISINALDVHSQDRDGSFWNWSKVYASATQVLLKRFREINRKDYKFLKFLYSTLVKLNPHKFHYQLEQGIAYVSGREYDKANQVFQQCLEKFPEKKALTYFWLYKTAIENKKFEEAEQYNQKIFDENPWFRDAVELEPHQIW